MFALARLPAVPFYIQEWLPKRGRLLIYAPAKSGKSLMCLQIARCIGSGEPFLEFDTTKGRVLYVQFELGEEILQRRIKQTHKDYDNVWVGTSFGLKLDLKSGQELLLNALNAVEPDVLILDPLYKAIMGDENEGSDVRLIIDFLDDVIEAYGCSIILIHHAGKDLSKRGRGSSLIEDWVDSYVRMTRVKDSGGELRVKLTPQFLRHAPLPDEPIEALLSTDDFEFYSTGATLTCGQMIAKYIQASQEPVSPKDLVEQGFGGTTTVFKELRKLIDTGWVEKAGYGQYQWLGKLQE